MHIDRERQQALEQEKAAAEAEIRKLLTEAGSQAPHEALRALQERVRAINEELGRMEFATEIERQSDA